MRIIPKVKWTSYFVFIESMHSYKNEGDSTCSTSKVHAPALVSYCILGREEIATWRTRSGAARVYVRVFARHAAISSRPRIRTLAYVLSKARGTYSG
jgi:hypothetical protein